MKGRAAETTGKRPRGRPRKTPAAAAAPVNGKRRPGRPRKMGLDDLLAWAEEETAAIETVPRRAVVEPIAAPSWAGEPRAQTGRRVVLSLKISPTLALAIAEAAEAEGVTQKMIVTRSLRQAGLPTDPADLQDGSPKRHADRLRAVMAAE